MAAPRPMRADQDLVMVVDDDASIRRAVRRVLSPHFRVLECDGGPEALELLPEHEPAVLLVDFFMPGMSGVEFLSEVIRRYPESPSVRVVLSAHTDAEQLQAFVNRCRISHYIAKPFDVAHLRTTVADAVAAYRRACEQRVLVEENERLRRRLSERAGFKRIVGTSPQLQSALARFEQVCHSDVTVHIQGETGTGKELVARALHEGGPRRGQNFVAQNCAGLESTLLQSTLFGHKKGAFTGADRDRPGVFQQAHQGTLFLDEVAELTPAVQAALLRAIQEGEVTPVGATKPDRVDIRLISATHVDLHAEVALGRFRRDLYHRLVVVAVELPPLRDRSGDVSVLAQHFLRHYCDKYGKSVAPLGLEVMRILEGYDWPGNVRELANEVERLVVLAPRDGVASGELLSPHLRDSVEERRTEQGVFIPYGLGYDEAQKRLARTLIERAMADSGGVVRAAADALLMQPSRLAKLRRRLGVGRSAGPAAPAG